MFVQLKTWWIQSKVWLWTTNESGKWTCTNLLVLRLSHPNISMMMFRPLTVQQADLDLSLIRCSLATSEPVACWLWDGAILNLVVQRTNTSNFWTFLQENKILHCKMYRLWKIWKIWRDKVLAAENHSLEAEKWPSTFSPQVANCTQSQTSNDVNFGQTNWIRHSFFPFHHSLKNEEIMRDRRLLTTRF